VIKSRQAGMVNIKRVFMRNEDSQLKELFMNYEDLEDRNKDKLLLVGKKLLSIKNLVKSKNQLSETKKENTELKIETDIL
jgi:hypothetical protein